MSKESSAERTGAVPGGWPATSVHHFGLVVPDIEVYLARMPMWTLHGQILEDSLQKSRLCLVSLTGDSSPPIVELVQPVGADAPTARAAAGGGGWHHVCIAARSVSEGDEMMRRFRLMPVTPWKPAVLFGGRPVRFAYSRQRELIELIADETDV
ncbi:MAG TPA: VOC family protein [Gemmatimonadaceae bacterium]|nr:VOC family protein [Gemmatimonadaceae bacterium]